MLAKTRFLATRAPSKDDLEDNYERYGLYFSEPIGYILKADGTRIPLNYGEVKIKKTTGKYHVIPRTSY
ncbi:hypothetical protein [Microcoleus sp.]|uniref:DUF6972 family protein n=1 Tax=Microcoleus sp. TaxID=44472 RepID=UPI00352452C1